METRNREGKPGKIFRVHDGEDFRVKVEVYHPYLVFVETNCWYELTAWKLAQYRVKYRRMEICVFTYDRLLPARAAGFMRSGADSFLDLRDDDEATRSGINRIIRGDVYMPEWVSGAEGHDQEGPGEHPGLTRREREAFRLVGLGNGDKEIARKMGVSYGVAKNYLSSIRRKLGIKRTDKLPILALRAGLVRYDELVNPEIGLDEA
ncbi:MAG: LuxR C-terminal-related transcriptional regulator [Treponema sp.]|nr:LuxR C-terminal-related transcriptional regulator [Treponema sp.]